MPEKQQRLLLLIHKFNAVFFHYKRLRNTSKLSNLLSRNMYTAAPFISAVTRLFEVFFSFSFDYDFSSSNA